MDVIHHRHWHVWAEESRALMLQLILIPSSGQMYYLKMAGRPVTSPAVHEEI